MGTEGFFKVNTAREDNCSSYRITIELRYIGFESQSGDRIFSFVVSRCSFPKPNEGS